MVMAALIASGGRATVKFCAVFDFQELQGSEMEVQNDSKEPEPISSSSHCSHKESVQIQRVL
jgi:hypothetical protein